MKTLEQQYMKLQSDLRNEGCKINYGVYSQLKKDENLKQLLKTQKGKEFLKFLRSIPNDVKITQPFWANIFTKKDGKFHDSFSGKNLTTPKFALNRIQNNSTTISKSVKFN